MFILALGVGIASLGCWIWVLVSLFRAGLIWQGVVSICPCVGFIFGWMKANELDLQKVMLVWSVCVVINFILNILLKSGSM